MLSQRSSLSASSSLRPDQIADLRLAASKMTGAKRRAFQAEMTLQYCAGNARQGETSFGWGRSNIEVGLAEKRTGVICLGLQPVLSGRKRWEDKHPDIALALREIAEAHAQQAPTFRTALAYTRLTAQATLEALRQRGYDEAHLPALSTMAGGVNRLGYRLRKVVKAKPQKKMKQTDAIFDNIKKTCSRPLLESRQTLECGLSSDGASGRCLQRRSDTGGPPRL